MDWGQLAIAFVAGLAIAFLTVPVGVSGAVFLLPVQLDLLRIPSPAVTPTNLLYNVVSGPGSLIRHWQQGSYPSELTRSMLTGTVPGVVAGALVRVFLVPDAGTFRLIAGCVLLPIGVWLVVRAWRGTGRSGRLRLTSRWIGAIGFGVGIVGGVYGIGGGSILAPILVAGGLPVARVAPAALASTFVTSIVGAACFALLAGGVSGEIAPDWGVGIACGLGGLLGGYLGVRVQRYLPERALTAMLGVGAVALAVIYALQWVAQAGLG